MPPGKSVDSGASTEISARQLTAWYPEYTFGYLKDTVRGGDVYDGGIVTERGVEWKSSACILCECNCGILVKLGGEDGRRFEQIRGDKAHQASKGYT